jgi:hypothetical protein
MTLENEKKITRRSSPKPQKPRAKKTSPMAKSISEPQTGPGNLEKAPDFPDEWISIAAYYIWKNDGEPHGQNAEYWERAKAELATIWREGNLPTARQSADEER